MEKDLEYYKTMFANKAALSMENIKDIQEAGKWLINQAEKVETLEKQIDDLKKEKSDSY
jgi:hypothetical protein